MGDAWERRRLHFLWILVLLVAGGCDGCGCDKDRDRGSGCNFGDSGDDDGGCSSSDDFDDDDACICPDGSTCSAFGNCPDDPPPLGNCADGQPRCGFNCCEGSELCWSDSCVAPGPSCNSSADCTEDQVCSFDEALATIDTDVCITPLSGACLPRTDPSCDLPSIEVSSAMDTPDVSFTGDSVLTPPVIAQLDDDDCNTVIDEGDAPDVIFTTASGALVVASPDDVALTERWSDTQVTSPNDPTTLIAATRHDGEAYVVVCTEDDRVRAYDHAGGIRWLSEPLSACDAPTIGILEGAAFVVAEGGILSLTSGAVDVPFVTPLGGPPIIADVDSLSAGNEIVTPDEIRGADGAVLATSGRPGSFVAVADLDGDLSPEIVSVESASGQHHLTLWQMVAGAPVVVRMDVDINAALVDPCQPADPGADHGGGPPAIADLTGDGNLDVAVAGARGVVVFSGIDLLNIALTDAETVVTEIPLADCQDGRRGLSAFDFDDNGIAELVARDETRVHVLNAVDAGTLWSGCAPSEASYGATPIVDVDRDGSAEILAIASSRQGTLCDGSTSAGVDIFQHEAGGWAGAPGQWLQQADPSAGATGMLAEIVSPTSARATPSSRDAADLALQITAPCASAIDLLVENNGAQPIPLSSAFVRIYGTVGGVSTDIALLPVPVPLESGARVRLQHPLEGDYEGITAVLEFEAGRAVFECNAGSQVSVACN